MVLRVHNDTLPVFSTDEKQESLDEIVGTLHHDLTQNGTCYNDYIAGTRKTVRIVAERLKRRLEKQGMSPMLTLEGQPIHSSDLGEWEYKQPLKNIDGERPNLFVDFFSLGWQSLKKISELYFYATTRRREREHSNKIGGMMNGSAALRSIANGSTSAGFLINGFQVGLYVTAAWDGNPNALLFPIVTNLASLGYEQIREAVQLRGYRNSQRT